MALRKMGRLFGLLDKLSVGSDTAQVIRDFRFTPVLGPTGGRCLPHRVLQIEARAALYQQPNCLRVAG